MPSHLSNTDPEIATIVAKENTRQERAIELIASENIVSRTVMEAQGSGLTNKYAEGYPAKRYYGGCTFVNAAENLAIERAKTVMSSVRDLLNRRSPCKDPYSRFLATDRKRKVGKIRDHFL